VLERSLYNAAIAGVSFAGDTFFYPNPLEADGRYAFNQGALTRKPWFDCSCCPTNLARFIPSIPDYIYAAQGDVLFVNLFVASTARVAVGGTKASVTQQTGYPWDGHVELAVAPETSGAFEIRLRIPGWARGEPVPGGLYRYLGRPTGSFGVRVNGKPVSAPVEKGYVALRRKWSRGDVIGLDLPLAVRRVLADDRVADDRGRVAIERGPIVYCAEGIDNDGSALDIVLPDHAALTPEPRPGLLGGVTVLRGAASTADGRAAKVTLVPYYAWSNRGPGEMAVWLKRAAAR
jgi:DUF1680 family protein